MQRGDYATSDDGGLYYSEEPLPETGEESEPNYDDGYGSEAEGDFYLYVLPPRIPMSL